jgi:hypothetical protein
MFSLVDHNVETLVPATPVRNLTALFPDKASSLEAQRFWWCELWCGNTKTEMADLCMHHSAVGRPANVNQTLVSGGRAA